MAKKNFRQSRICYFRYKCVVFAGSCKFAIWNFPENSSLWWRHPSRSNDILSLQVEVYLPLPSMHLWATVSLSMLIQIRMKKHVYRDYLTISFLFGWFFNKVNPFTSTRIRSVWYIQLILVTLNKIRLFQPLANLTNASRSLLPEGLPDSVAQLLFDNDGKSFQVIIFNLI